jgi:hypothetical protein
MYDFFYNKMLKKCPSKIDVGFSDTDSFLFKATKPKKFLKHLKPYMDFSNYDPLNEYYDASKKSQLGYFKDELGGKLKCTEFIGLRSKCYAMNLKNPNTNEISEKKTCKGLARIAIKNRLRFIHYKKCLKKHKTFRFSFNSIRSQKQNVFTIRQNKKALSYFDSKRWLFDCGIHSQPYGSILIKKYFNRCPTCKKVTTKKY